MNTRRAKVKRLETHQYAEHESVDWNICNTHISFHYIIKQLWTFYLVHCRYGVIFTPPRLIIVNFFKYHTIFTVKKVHNCIIYDLSENE